jgi:selenocysteine-specific elongation factor
MIEMGTRNYIVATAGHVDHGKSALVKALTGIDPDRLPEEKARGITIDLGFAHLELPSPLDPQPSIMHLGIVDVPGHEDFVKNMVAGVGSIDLALFVVAADDGWMPQSEEHLQILGYLGVTRAVVALTKIDLAADESARVAHVRDRLAGSPFAEASIVPTSTVSGRGIDELKMALADTLGRTPPPRDIGKPRLPVDRVFTLRGVGTVVTGTLIGGELRRGQTVVIQPSGRTARIRSLQNHNRDADGSGPGTRTALNLPDVEGSGETPGVQRGNVITLPDLGGPGDGVDVLLERSPRPIDSRTGPARPLKDRTRIRFHLGSGNVAGTVHFLDVDALPPGGRALARLRLEGPVFAFAGDRFIIRDWSEQSTLAGGVVLDPGAADRGITAMARKKFLQRRAEDPSDLVNLVLSLVERDRAVRRAGLLVQSRFSANEIRDAVATRLPADRVKEAGEWLVDRAWWEGLLETAAAKIDAAHQTHPERAGLALSELRAIVDVPVTEVFDALVADLCGRGFTQSGVAIRRSAHRPALPPQLQNAGSKVRAALSAKPLDPPSRKEIAPDAAAQQALRFLLQTGEAIDLSEEVVLSADAFARAAGMIAAHLRARGAATAGELRQALGTSRRVVIPLLERLDKDGLTRREGDRRVLRKAD